MAVRTEEIALGVILGVAVAPFLRVLVDDIPKRPFLDKGSSDLRAALTSSVMLPVASWFHSPSPATLVAVGSPDLAAEGETRPLELKRWRAPLFDLVTATVFGILVGRFGIVFSTLPLLVFGGSLVVASTIDIDHYRLPDRLVFPSLFMCAALIAGAVFIDGVPRSLLPALLGALGYFLFLFIFFLISPSGMGFGDVKLALLLGLNVGWVGSWSKIDGVVVYHGVPSGLRLVLMAALFGSLLGTVVGLCIIPFRGRKAHFPFGPSLCLGAFLAIVFSEVLI